MNVCSLEFLLALTAVSALLFRLRQPRSRQAVLGLCAAGFLATHLSDPSSWALLLAFLLSGYACARALVRRPSHRLLWGYLALLVATFAVLKRYEFLTPALPAWMMDHPVAIVGLSYMLFRQIHFLVDSMQGQIVAPSLWDYLNYQLNPFTLLAGPIQRFPQFLETWTQLSPVLRDRHELLRAYQRVFIGVVKVGVVAAAFLYVHGRLAERLGGQETRAAAVNLKSTAMFIFMIYMYFVYIYCNFSGYCDIAIASGSLVGLRIPENFNRPYMARNLLEYWTRWHITLGAWIRDYLFSPLYKSGVERWPGRAQSLAVACYFVAFLAAGIWHGSSWNFFIFGLLHGAGASTVKLWENAIVRYGGRAGLKRYLASPIIRWVAIAATFHYTCFALFFFAFDLDRCLKILRSLFPGV